MSAEAHEIVEAKISAVKYVVIDGDEEPQVGTQAIYYLTKFNKEGILNGNNYRDRIVRGEKDD